MSLIESGVFGNTFPFSPSGLVSNWFPEMGGSLVRSPASAFTTDIVETPKEVIFKVDVPGYKKVIPIQFETLYITYYYI